jgi:hypothetical protein
LGVRASVGTPLGQVQSRPQGCFLRGANNVNIEVQIIGTGQDVKRLLSKQNRVVSLLTRPIFVFP